MAEGMTERERQLAYDMSLIEDARVAAAQVLCWMDVADASTRAGLLLQAIETLSRARGASERIIINSCEPVPVAHGRNPLCE